MVSVLPPQLSPWQVIGKAMSQFGQNAPELMERRYQQSQLRGNLDEISKLAQSGGSPLDVTLAAMKAGAGIPGSERYLGQIIPMLQQLTAANASQNAPLAGEQPGMQRDRMPMEPMAQRQQAPTFMNQPQTQAQQNFPTAVGPQGGPGQVPQEATTGQKQRILSPAERIPEAKKLAAERTKAGIPTTAKEALEEIKENEKEKQAYNEAIDKELEQRRKGQQTYGQKAVDYLKNVLPEASPELQARFQKLGEEASRKGDSEADINAYLAKKATDLGDQITNIRKSLSAPRIQNYIQRKANGDYREFEDAAKDVRNHLKPLLDQGLYDTARVELQDLGYGPEERDMIINPLDERSKVVLNGIPEVPKASKHPSFLMAERGPADKNNIKEALIGLKNSNPNFSLLLARKALEDKGYDWRSFKNAVNEMIEEGQFEYSGDQKNNQDNWINLL